MAEQLHFNGLRDESYTPAVARGIFSMPYLRRRTGRLPHASVGEATDRLYEFSRALWAKNWLGLSKGSEAYTRTHFLDPLLAHLGWHFIPELKQNKHERPDYWLFANEEQQLKAAAADVAEHRFTLSCSVLEAKKVGHPLDALSKHETAGLFPSQQVQGYLHRARDAQGRRFFDWAILTNGERWRLYSERAAADAFFEFRLADGPDFCTRGEFALFAALFCPAAFVRADTGRCPLDDIQSESLSLQTELEENLRRRIFDVLEELASAFVGHAPNGVGDGELKDGSLYDACLVFLYRLLFVLYAESRFLLPVRAHGAGHNKHYREKFSLQRLVASLKLETKAYAEPAFCDLYEDLLKLFRLIDGRDEALNATCGVTRYNGGLFAGGTPVSQRIERWRIPDPALARVLRQLVFAQPPARGGNRQQRIRTDETIDYSTLEVRQLGDIYEGLLGGQLRRTGKDGPVQLVGENGQNHRNGVYYTPDWVVRYLVRATLDPLLDRIEASDEVRKALAAKTDEERAGDAFALGVLGLNLVDPAMGSGHFLVRATEYLADRVFRHATTRRKTERVVSSGEGRRTREDIEAAGRIPIPAGLSQEEAEIAYWRRRIVEACIYGVDLNPMAAELAKLSLWLTCIAMDEPLSFLDHHLRHGNSLLSARVSELSLPPSPESGATPIELAGVIEPALREVIRRNVDIEATASTRLDLVKKKEAMWREARRGLEPLLRVADLWIGALCRIGLPQFDYMTLVRRTLAPETIPDADRPGSDHLMREREGEWYEVGARMTPFHWEIEFPDVFFAPDGTPLPPGAAGFDAVLGNPPYVSTQTGAGHVSTATLQARWGYSNDLYVFFTDLGLRLLRDGGRIGFIVSDTFFTLESKADMRGRLQSHRLDVIGQCDPFDATVDAAMFVAEKSAPLPVRDTLFVQARARWAYGDRRTQPDLALPLLPDADVAWAGETALAAGRRVRHAVFRDLRLHAAPLSIWRDAHKSAFFEPRPGTLRLYERFNDRIKALHEEWWERIETSEKFARNRPRIVEYLSSLKPGDITLVGLVAEGGQGLATANNARFLGYLEGTPQAHSLLVKRNEWTARWLADSDIGPRFRELLAAAGGNPAKPLDDGAAWEATVDPLRTEFPAAKLGFGKTDLYRIVPNTLVAESSDFEYAWKVRKKELWDRWRTRGELKGFWTTAPAARVTDEEFCRVCGEIQAWVTAGSERRKKETGKGLPKDLLGLRSSETYGDPADAPRIATIYSGLRGRAQWVPFRKGDPDGNRWVDDNPLFIRWVPDNVTFLFENSGRHESGMPVIRNPHLYLTAGVTWTRVANHVAVKARIQAPCVFDSDSVRLTPLPEAMSASAFLAVFNSDIFSFLKMRFLQHTAKWEIGNMRQLPIVIPSVAQAKRLDRLARLAIAAKRHGFAGETPPDDLVGECREIAVGLIAGAPAYLQPPAQAVTYQSPDDCLAILERAVNWEAEKLYGVERLGPFDEF
jgi:hypothetical protein